MALHTTLPIYKAAYTLFDLITDLAKNMPRDFKRSIGGKLPTICRLISEHVMAQAFKKAA